MAMQLKIQNCLISLIILTALMIGGCTERDRVASETTPPVSPTLENPVSPSSETPTLPTQSISPLMKDLPTLTGKATVVMTVKGAPITIEVDGTNAPITAGNFVDLVQRGVYDGLVFHRVVRQPEPFVVQGGDPQGKDPKFPIERLGTSGFIDPKTGSERRIPLEITPEDAKSPLYSEILKSSPELKHLRGAVAMARSQSPDSASSQFYFALADLAFLDGSYAVFGNVTSGMEVVDKIQEGDRIETAKVTSGAENLKNGGK